MDEPAEEDYDLDMPDRSGTSSRLVFKLIHPRIVKCSRTRATVSFIITITIIIARSKVQRYKFFAIRLHSTKNLRKAKREQTSGTANKFFKREASILSFPTNTIGTNINV